MVGSRQRRGASSDGSNPSPVFVLDEAGRFTYVNEDAEGIFETHRRKLEGKTFWAQVPDDMEEDYREPFARALERGEPTEFENRCPVTGRWYRFEAYPFEDHLSVHAHDIEDRMRREGAFELRERSLRSAHRIITDRDRSAAETIEALLKVLRNALDTELAAVSHVDRQRGTYRLVAVAAAPGRGPPVDEDGPLTEHPACAEVVQTGETVSRREVPRGAGRPGAYLGTPIRVDEEIHGTLAFSSRQARSEGFADWQVSYVEMFASWIGRVLERGDGGEEQA